MKGMIILYKMGHPQKCYIAITLFFASIVVQGVAELITVRHLLDEKSDSERITCMSDDEDAALIWNYDSTAANVQITKDFTSFHPNGGNLQATNNCEIGTSDSRSCIVEWKRNESSREWTTVDSISNPMGPVSDYRWERFKESDPKQRGYAFLRKVSTGTVVFSVRGSRHVQILVGEDISLTDGSCIRIVIGSEMVSDQSVIRTCSGKELDNLLGQTTNDMGEQKTVIKEYEWRTFTVIWNGTTVQVFNNIDENPFLQGKGGFGKLRGSYLGISVEQGSRVRVHDYVYLQTRKKNVVIHTKYFHSENDNLCLKLLIGLCAKCGMKIDLVDEHGATLRSKIIDENERSMMNGLVTWQSVKLQYSNLQSSTLLLRVSTTLRGPEKGEGHWALDGVRTCKADGEIIGSTVTVRKMSKPKIVCQRISYTDGDVIDAMRKNNKPNLATNHLEKFLDNLRYSCGSLCGGVGKGSIICNSENCTCDRGFRGEDCTEECALGRYGYNCKSKCESCKDHKCNKNTGDCDECKNSEFEPPLCADRTPRSRVHAAPTIHNLRADEPSDTDVTLRWRRDPPANGKNDRYDFVIKNVELLGCKKTERLEDVTMSVEIRNDGGNCAFRIPKLHPYAKYRAIVTTFTSQRVSETVQVDFKTKARDVPTAKVSNLRFDNISNRIEWGEPGDCTTITGETKYTTLVFKPANVSKPYRAITTQRLYCDLSSLKVKLDPFTLYEVRAYISRDSKTNSSVFQTTTLTTPPAAPPRVTNLKVYAADSDRNTISLQWSPPSPARGILETYHISIAGKSETLRAADGNKTGCQNGYVCSNDWIVPKDAEKNNTQITVYAKNHGVNEFGDSASISFVPALYLKEPGKPQNLTASSKGGGNIELKWKKSPVSYAKLSYFEIRATVVETEQAGLLAGTQFRFNHTVQQKKQSSYTQELRLPPSTLFQISVVAVNVNNIKSSSARTNASTQGKIRFKTGEEINIKPNKESGTLIDLEVPTVENASNNTWINIVVKGPVTCLNDYSKPSEAQEWNVTSYRADKKAPKSITIGADHAEGTSGCKLRHGGSYKVEVVVKDETYDETVSKTSRQISLIEIEDGGFNASWLIILPVVAFFLLAMFFIRRRISCSSLKSDRFDIKPTTARVISRQPSYLELLPLSPTMARGNSSAAQLMLQSNGKERRTSAYLYSVPNEPDSWRVPVENFEEYVKNAVTSAQLYSQFKLLPEGSTKPSNYGRLAANIHKNRYTNLIAYDDTRVILWKTPGDPYSDYINANYIRGFGKERAYIATQGPMEDTVEDFWRMVWQEDVRVICMLTNVIEGGEKKCEQYWPDIGDRVKYGEFVISNAEHKIFADFTFRSFKMSYKQKTRDVAHLHYTGWPSFEIPTYPQSLALYLKKLLKLPAGDGPVVVHCHTGDDRTGTIILCDICLREVVRNKVIDVTGVTTRLRESRANMVGTLQQFLLAHIMIAESLMARPTQVPCDNILPKRIKELRDRLLYDIERLNDTNMWQQQTLKSLAEPKPLQETAEGAEDRLPGTGISEVVYDNLHSTFERRISQIRAVSVDGVKMKRQHLASHLPPPLKLLEFWEFVIENNVKLIIILQSSDPDDPNWGDIMPDESIVLQMPNIEFVAQTNIQDDNEDEYFKSGKLMLVETSQENAEPQSVTVFTCRGWARGSNGKLPEPMALVSLWMASERIPRAEGQTLVLCHDGITACGLYLAMSFLLERMAVERECDVISAVRAVRRSRPEFVQSVKQFEYLYDAAETYTEFFQHYWNFT